MILSKDGMFLVDGNNKHFVEGLKVNKSNLLEDIGSFQTRLDEVELLLSTAISLGYKSPEQKLAEEEERYRLEAEERKAQEVTKATTE